MPAVFLKRYFLHLYDFQASSNTTCSMTFCFSFEVFIALKPIQVNMKRGGPTYYYKAKRRDESRSITSRYWKLQYGSANLCCVILQVS